jgi:hypothetical protein
MNLWIFDQNMKKLKMFRFSALKAKQKNGFVFPKDGLHD